MTVPHASADRRTQMGAVAFAIAGVLFAVYEAVAPRADETTLDGAAAWASAGWGIAGWGIAHISAIVGLILIPLGYGAIRGLLDGTPQEKTAYLAAVIGYIGSGLTISYYGAEVYGLKAIGERAMADGDPSLTDVGNDFRLDPTGDDRLRDRTAARRGRRRARRDRGLALGFPAPLERRPARRSPGHHAPPVLPPARRADRLGRTRRHRGPVACHCALACVNGPLVASSRLRGRSGSVAAIAQGVDHALQDPERVGLIGRTHAGQHPDLDRSDRHGRLLELPPALGCEPRG